MIRFCTMAEVPLVHISTTLKMSDINSKLSTVATFHTSLRECL